MHTHTHKQKSFGTIPEVTAACAVSEVVWRQPESDAVLGNAVVSWDWGKHNTFALWWFILPESLLPK